LKRSLLTLSLISMPLALGGLSALSAQTVVADQTSMTFFSQLGGSASSAILNIGSNGGATFFTVTVSSNAPWLKVNNQNFIGGNTPSAVTVTADPTNLPAAVYTGTLSVTGGSGPGSSVAVSFTVSTIGVNPQTVSFAHTLGGILPASQSVSLTGPLTAYTATATTAKGGPWLGLLGNTGLVNTLSGLSPGTLTLGIDPTIVAGLAADTYTGAVTITPTSGPATVPLTVAVVLTVTPTPPVSANPSSLIFNIQVGGTNNITSQTVTISSVPGLALNFVSSVDPNPVGSNWIVLGAAVGVTDINGAAQVTIGVNPNLPPGTYRGKATVVSQGSPSSLDILVTLLISNSPLLNVPAAALNFTYPLGGNVPASQSVTVTATSGTLAYTIVVAGNAPWLSVPTNGTTPTPFAVTINQPGLAGLTPGTYSTTLNITGTGAGNGVQQIPVNLKITNDPNIVASVPSVSFPFQTGKAAPAPVTVNLTSSTGVVLNYTATATATTCGNNWLLLNGAANGTVSAATAGSFQLSVNTAGLLAGICTGNVSVTATTAAGTAAVNSPIAIPVTLFVSNTALLVASPASPLFFTALQGGPSPAIQTINLITTSASDQLTFTAAFATNNNSGNWLPVSTITGTTPTLLQVPVNSSLLSAGVYTGAITITATGATPVANSPLVIPVTLTVSPGTISAPTATLTFNQITGAPAPPAQTIAVTGSPVSLPFTATAGTQQGSGWLTALPPSGNTPGTVTVSVSAAGLSPGVYKGSVTIAALATGSPITVPVVFNVFAAQSIATTPASINFSYTLALAPPPPVNLTVSGSAAGTPFSYTVQTTSGPPNWLVVTPAPTGLTTPATLAVSIVTAGLTAGNFSGSITIASPNVVVPTVVPVSLTVVSVPIPVIGAIANAASFANGPVAPGENIVIFGTGIGPATLVLGHVTNGVVDPSAGNTRVLFDGVAAPVIYASALQTSVMVPYGVAGRTSTNVQVEFLGVQSAAIPFNLLQATPGIYTLNQAGTGPGATLNQDGVTVNGPGTPAAKGSVVSIYMTGEGQTTPVGADGAIIPADGTGLKKPNLAVTATIGGVAATVTYAGSAPGIVSGVMQVNVQIPAGAASGGAVPLVITVGTTPCQSGVTVAVQ
jgi:uncharacterized protein (TIGR03437 family)